MGQVLHIRIHAPNVTLGNEGNEPRPRVERARHLQHHKVVFLPYALTHQVATAEDGHEDWRAVDGVKELVVELPANQAHLVKEWRKPVCHKLVVEEARKCRAV